MEFSKYWNLLKAFLYALLDGEEKEIILPHIEIYDESDF